MEAELFRAFQRIAHDEAGIHLGEGKDVLVRTRIAGRLRELGLGSEREYLARLEADLDGELTRFLDLISTNFTKFFREPSHFEALRAEAVAARAAGQRRFRFWSAGCSSGEEPYTAAMALANALDGCDWRILATDISTRVLAHAAEAVYREEEVAAVPPAYRRFLEPAPPDRDRPCFRIAAPLRERVVFRRLNLAARPFPMRGPLDAVFCRNVMIYFDGPMRSGLVNEIAKLLRPGAPLFVGHSETLNGVSSPLVRERPSVYRRPLE